VKKTVLVRGPALTQSGYGEHTRFVLRALRMREDEFDIHILPTKWGETGWLAIPGEERAWIDQQVNKATVHLHQKLPYDISVQVTIPNEWQKMAAVNIGVTAGIETNKVAPVWIQQANLMDKIITISEHSKSGFDAVYSGQHPQTGQEIHLVHQTPVELAHYPVQTFDGLPELDLNLEHDFNYLAVAQWGPRKNIQNLIRWFVEENHDEEVGLIVKMSLKNNSVVDREFALQQIENSIPDIPDRKCKVYLLHGDMSEGEMHALYRHPKVKVMVSLTHGEGYGLPLFEAAYSGLPIIAPGWSGQCDFLYMPWESKSKKSKNKKKAMFAEVDFTLGPVPDAALWQGVIEKGMSWCYPTEGSFKLRMRQVRKNYDKWLAKAAALRHWVCEEFAWDKKHEGLLGSIAGDSRLEPEPVTGISFCISTNGAKPEKTELEIKSIHNTMAGVEVPYEIIVAGNATPFAEMGIVAVQTPEDAENGLLAKLRNNAGQRAQYGVVLFVDDDFIFPQTWAQRFVEYSQNNGWQMTANKILLPDGGRFWDRAIANEHTHSLVDYDYPPYSKSLYQTGGFWIMRKALYEAHKWNSEIGINAERDGGINEDIEMSARMHANGVQFCFDKDNTVWHNDDSYVEFDNLTLKRTVLAERYGGFMLEVGNYDSKFEDLLEKIND